MLQKHFAHSQHTVWLPVTYSKPTAIAHWSRSMKLTYTLGPVSTGMGDHVWVQFLMPDIYVGM